MGQNRTKSQPGVLIFDFVGISRRFLAIIQKLRCCDSAAGYAVAGVTLTIIRYARQHAAVAVPAPRRAP